MKKRPNILLLMTDEQRHDAVGYRNSDLVTPHLDALARDSIDFANAYTTNPSCIPARAAIFSGRYPSQCGAPCYITPLARNEKTFMSLLRDDGYYTAVIGKQHFWTYEGDRGYNYEDIVDEHAPPDVISRELGEAPFGPPANKTVSDRVSSYVSFLADHGFRRGNELYEPVSRHGVYRWKADERYYVDAYVGDRGARWLEDSAPNQPWFLTVSFPGPHMPFDGLGLPDDEDYEGRRLSLPRTTAEDVLEKPPHYRDLLSHYCSIDESGAIRDRMPDEEILLMRRAYYANVSLIDRKIGALLDILRRRGEYDNTLILFVSDHGEYLGDFGMATKAQYPSEALMRIPFLLKPPVEGFSGYREDSFVSSVELAATCLRAAGTDLPGNISQRSLTQFYEDGPRTLWETVYMEARDIRAIRDRRYKLCHYAWRDYGELYDLESDPLERHNLWGDPRAAGQRERLTVEMLNWFISLGENTSVPWNMGAPDI